MALRTASSVVLCSIFDCRSLKDCIDSTLIGHTSWKAILSESVMFTLWNLNGEASPSRWSETSSEKGFWLGPP